MGEVLEAENSDLSLSGELNTHKNIHTHHSYKLLELKEDYAKISINLKKSETVDHENIIYDGSIFSAANFCAIAAVNEKHTFLISANIDFLNQVNTDDEEVIFEAHASSNISGKKQIEVTGTVNGITVFQGDFVAMKLDNKSIIKSTK
jgi:acyl-coenzyme A thioesterase PaaI-like protein